MDETPEVRAALAHGATIEWRTDEWVVTPRTPRGRTKPLATFHAPTRARAAAMFCEYFHVKPKRDE